MNILCKLFGHKYKTIYNIFNEPIKVKCVRCNYMLLDNYRFGFDWNKEILRDIRESYDCVGQRIFNDIRESE